MVNTTIYAAQENSERIHFNKMARKYDKNYTYNNEFTQFKIIKKLDKLFGKSIHRQPLRILEIGAGTGEYTIHLAQRFPNAEIIAIDISPDILQVAKEKCRNYKNVTFKVCSAYNLPYKSNTFNIVCGFYILHHLDVSTALSEVSRVLKVSGSGLFYEPNILNPLVFLIKSIPSLKRWVGDSEHEWAINPLALGKHDYHFSDYTFETSEYFLLPFSLPFTVTYFVDTLTSLLAYIPLVNLFGGSVAIQLKK